MRPNSRYRQRVNAINVNQTTPESFMLLPLTEVPTLQAIYFFVFLLMYILTLSGNILLISVVGINSSLQTPMYFFLSNLSVIDICMTCAIVPKLLINILMKDRIISFLGCAMQMFFHLALGAAECFILAIMAYDRFAAICRPLHYNNIMNKLLCVSLIGGAWCMSFMNSTVHTVITFQLPYCKSLVINHFFCEIPAFFQLSCQDTFFNEIAMYISGGIIGVSSFCLTLISYVHIIIAVLKVHSSQGRRKVFSTCGSHLTVVCLYYGTLMVVYLRPHSIPSAEINKTMSIFYTTVSPMLNPIIYSMRNKEVKSTFIKKKTRF
ncbi:olfactory receptor 5AR1-like [Hyperolius riggenbachi]|uniref:olfactory receptor 5AR1-like n=1 Tax=Hyperolius riggenbachi TaxID=752182 RepID=UPI0035A29434